MKLFYDHLIVLGDLEIHIKNAVEIEEERHELWEIIDEIIHHRILEALLDRLPNEHHDEFLHKFHESPHDEGLIEYLTEKIQDDIESLIKSESKLIYSEIIGEIKLLDG